MIFLGLKFWPKVIFWVYERRRDFFGSQKETEGIFLACEKRTKGFVLGMNLCRTSPSLEFVSGTPGCQIRSQSNERC